MNEGEPLGMKSNSYFRLYSKSASKLPSMNVRMRFVGRSADKSAGTSERPAETSSSRELAGALAGNSAPKESSSFSALSSWRCSERLLMP